MNKSRKYGDWYSLLLRLYPRSFRERFAEGMKQTFNDLLRERAGNEQSLFSFALWIYFDTCAGIIREYADMMTTRHKNLVRIVLGIALVLLIPLVAMQFTDEVVWGPGDFVIAAVLLIGAGLAFEMVAGKGSATAYRLAVGVAVIAGLALVWTNLAVGLIGSGSDPANLMYAGVLAVGVIGAIVARFQPRGVSLALSATALAHALAAVVAVVIYFARHAELESVFVIVSLNAFFIALWIVSAFLFRHAAIRTAQDTARA